jgi:Flp pilus assembly pilin Flp
MHGFYDFARIRLLAMKKTDRGASAVEYALLLAFIAIAIFASVALFGAKVSLLFSNTSASLPS